VGNLPTSDLDNLRAARVLFGTGNSESYFREKFNSSLGIKYYAVCFLNQRYPSLKLMDRLLSEPTSPGYIPIKSVNFQEVQKFKIRVLAQEGLGRRSKTPPEPIRIEELEQYFGDPKGAGNNPTLVVGRKAWEDMGKSHPAEIVRKIAAGHLNGNTDFLTKVIRPNADLFNMVTEMVESGKGDLLKELLLKVKEGLNIKEVIEERDSLKTANQKLTDDLGTFTTKMDEVSKERDSLKTDVAKLQAEVAKSNKKSAKAGV